MPTHRPAEISGLNFMEEIAFELPGVSFPIEGVYEFQLWADGFDEWITRERIQARE